MLRKQLLRQSRAISQSIKSTSTSTSATPSLSQSLLNRSASFSSASLAPKTRAATPSTYQSSQILARRWQSTDSATQTPDAAASEAKSDGTPATEAAKEDPLKAELEKKNKEVIDLKDKYLRSVADYRNLQERTKRDMDSAKQFAIQRFAADLLDSIDNLDRALISVPADSVSPSPPASATPDHKKDLLSLYSGLKMTEEILLGTLKKHGLERFDPTEGEGRKFDPNTDEATFFTKVEGKQDGEVFFVQSKGFKLNGRVIRAAKVGVVKNS